MANSLTGTQLGDYIIGPQIDEGGMGAIYRAFKAGSKDNFVVKALLPAYSADAEFRKRFQREVTLLQKLTHPHIVPIYDFGEEGTVLYFVMPFIRGYSLFDLLRKQHFSPATAWLILDPIANALQYAHEQRVIHRDLKPSNILIEAGGTGSLPGMMRPFLADFGLSKPLDKSSMTQLGMTVGTPQYMAPEQVRADPVTARTDIYGLGIVIYEMLLGRVPFLGGSPDEIALSHIREMPPSPRSLHPAFPPMLEVVLLQALAKDPADRFETATAFSAAYWQAIQSLPLNARLADYWGSRL